MPCQQEAAMLVWGRGPQRCSCLQALSPRLGWRSMQERPVHAHWNTLLRLRRDL